MSINPGGAIAGIVGGYSGFSGFLRARHGNFIRLSQGSYTPLPVSINAKGAFTGFVRVGGVSHGFLLRPSAERK